ncbi:MAG: GAF domain-containing protein [Syntrophorhabdaceae bacterium]|nr:GAF domain-containing protein [Syntrophorhabdaceae bacterium]
MSVISILLEALRGERRSGEETTKGVSFAAALTSGLYEISQALSRPAEDVQPSFDLITSASASILRVEHCVLLFLEPEDGIPQIRSRAGIFRGKPLEKYRLELLHRVVKPVLSTGEGVIVSERRPGIDRGILRLMRRLDVQGFIVAPIKNDSSVIGLVIAASPLDRRELGDDDLKLLTVMANFASAAQGNAALVARLDKRARKLSAIFEISKALNEEPDHADLFQLIIDRAADLLGASVGSVVRVDHSSGLLYIEAERGLGGAVKSALKLRIGEGITGWVAKEGVPILVSDVRADPRYVEANPFVGCEMAVPIKWGTEVMGVINLDHNEVDGFQEEDLDMLTAFGHVAGVALRNANVLRDWMQRGK